MDEGRNVFVGYRNPRWLRPGLKMKGLVERSAVIDGGDAGERLQIGVEFVEFGLC